MGLICFWSRGHIHCRFKNALVQRLDRLVGGKFPNFYTFNQTCHWNFNRYNFEEIRDFLYCYYFIVVGIWSKLAHNRVFLIVNNLSHIILFGFLFHFCITLIGPRSIHIYFFIILHQMWIGGIIPMKLFEESWYALVAELSVFDFVKS